MKRCYSLKRNKEFRYTYRRGKSVVSGNMVLIYAKGHPGDEVKIGFSVSRKLGNAVIRNRVKRRLREAATPLISGIRKGFKLIIVARRAVVDEDFLNIRSTMAYMLKKAKLTVNEEFENRSVNEKSCGKTHNKGDTGV